MRCWFILLITISAAAQNVSNANTLTIRYSTTPTGTCSPFMYAVDNLNGDFYDCLNGGWNLVATGGGASSFNTITSGTNGNTLLVGSGGTLGVSGTGTITATAGTLTGTIFQKPNAADGIQFVSTEGNDTNDGLSWGTAKLTVDAAVLALPGAQASPPTTGNGTVNVTDGVYWNSNHACGFWRMGAGDPNYASPPTCWMRANGGLTIACGGTQVGGAAAHFPTCTINGGSQSDTSHPGIWLSSSSIGTNFRGIDLGYNGNPVKIGVCSDLTRATCGEQNVLFEHFADGMNSPASGMGPGVDIAGSSYWIYFRDYVLVGNQNATVTADNAAAVLIDGRGNPGNGLLHFDDGLMTSGGIKIYGGVDSGGVYVTNLSTENTMQASVWIAPTNAANVVARLDHVETSDCSTGGGAGCYGLENDGAPAGNVSVIDLVGGTLGTYTCAAGCPVNAASLPSVSGQVGAFNGHIVGQTDAARRLFPPVTVRSANLAIQAPGSWTTGNCSSCTVSGGITAPDGTANAGQVSTTAGGAQLISFYVLNNTPLSVGDYFLFGAWAQSQTANGFDQNVPLSFKLNGGGFGSGDTCTNGSGIVNVTGYSSTGWTWYSGICKISAAPTNAGLVFTGSLDSTHTAQFYAPVLVKFASGSIPDNDAYEYLSALSSYPQGATVGTKVNLAGTTDVILSTPASSSAACLAGQMWADTGFVYVCTATNTIKRVTLASF